MLNHKALSASVTGPDVDANFKQTVLLLHGDGTNGAQNNTFTDSSTNNFTITRNGNTTQGTFSPFSVAAGEWSNYFDGTGDYIENTSNYLVASTTSTFTIEAWVFMTADPVNDANNIPAMISVNGGGGNDIINYLAFGPISSRKLRIRWFDGTSKNAEGSTTLALNTWYHVACSVSSNAIKMFVNGVEETLSGTTTLTNRSGDANGFALGQTYTYANYTGYISNARVLSGTALYTTGFTPSTAPLTAITNTVLLTCQSNRFRDASSNAYAITTAGNTSVQAFSPFAPSAAYSTSTNGGSGYFDGSGDYLSASSNSAFSFGTGDFTWEAWIYKTGSWNTTPGTFDVIYGTIVTNGLVIARNDSNFVIRSFGVANLSSASLPPANAWNHIVAVRSGTTLSLYVNGTRVDTDTDSTNFAQGSITVGSDGAGSDYGGHISNLRVVKGTAVYDPTQTTLTVPTAPLTAITNTSLLLNFIGAAIFDQTGKNNLETVGNAQIDTTTKKFGTGSLEFDGTGDWLLMPNTPDQQLGTGNFTIEFWVYLASGDTGSNRGLVAKGTSTTGFLVSLNTTEKVVFTYATSTITSSGAITTNAWNHIAVVREGTGSNQTKIYIGGTNDGTGTVSTDFNQTSVMYVGANRTGGDPMKGFIDDLRITKGVARYTVNFTPPSRAFLDL